MKYGNVTALSFLFGLLLISSVSFADTVNKTCITNKSLQVNDTYTIDVGGNATSLSISKTIFCPLGCENNECGGTNIANESTSVWLTYAAGVTFMIIGIIMGAPYQKLSGQEKERPELTVTAVRYLFFFAGLYIIYNSFAMASGMGRTYGMVTGVQGAMDTNTIVIMITIGLFLFMFALDFLAMVINWTSHSADEAKWGARVPG